MTQKEMKRLKRAELLEMLIEQRKENERLKAELEQARKELENRKIEIGRSGSIAQAALRVNGVYEAAQAAAEQYLENVKAQADKYLSDVKAQAEQYLERVKSRAEGGNEKQGS